MLAQSALRADKALPNAVDKLTAEYEAEGKPYYRVEREYFSCGGIRFIVDSGPIQNPNQFDRYLMRAPAGQKANLFAYKSGDPGTPANMLTTGGSQGLTTDDSHTNIRAAYQTNGEDFAIMGLSLRIKGYRLEMTPGTAWSNPNPLQVASATFKNGITNGTIYLTDTSSDFLPPELSSPLVLEENFGRTLAKALDMRELWNQKQGDQVSLADSLGPGGGESYLHSLGEPTTHNIKRLSKGLIWRNVGTANSQDTNFALQCQLLEDLWQKISWPGTTNFSGFGPLVALNIDFKVTLHGVAFYVPSENV